MVGSVKYAAVILNISCKEGNTWGVACRILLYKAEVNALEVNVFVLKKRISEMAMLLFFADVCHLPGPKHGDLMMSCAF